MSNASVGGLLRKARLSLKLTLREVAEAVGVSIAYVSDVELGRREIAPKRVPQFAKALRLSEKDLAAVYRAAGVLPEGIAERLLKAPQLWNADFEQLWLHIDRAIEMLEDDPVRSDAFQRALSKYAKTRRN
jgi:transcriptional regulator with XRE-family HTH domain